MEMEMMQTAPLREPLAVCTDDSSSTLDPSPNNDDTAPRDASNTSPSAIPAVRLRPRKTSAGADALVARRSAILQFEQLMAMANGAEPEAPPRNKWWQFGKRPTRGPPHKDIDDMFPGLRHPPLSNEELQAFYYYSLASEPVVIVVFTALATIILQNMAAGAGVEASNHDLKCNYTVPGYQCVTYIAGTWVDPSSFSLYTIAFSVLCQAFFFISLGALADHSAFRKKFMMIFMFLAIFLLMCMVAIRHSSWFLVASALVILSQIFFGASYCFYNSYIPVLSAVHWDVLSATDEARLQVYEATMNTVSGISQVYGYLGAVGCFAVAGGVVFALQTISPSSGFGDAGFYDTLGVQTYSMQIGVFVAALWCLIGTYWPARYIRDRPYAPLPKGTNYITYSWKQVFKTVGRARQMPNTFLMLLAWFLLSDAMTTIGSTTILFATNELGFTSTEILTLAIVAPITAGGGNYLWLLIQRKYAKPTKSMLLLLVSLSILLPIYGILGFWLPFGLVHKWELFPAGIYYGCMLGAIQSFSRVMFSDLIPRGHEGEFFALYSITDKGSSWFGPL
ncbi:Autophagy protein 22, partial [Podochytrium sp. JEL0797]